MSTITAEDLIFYSDKDGGIYSGGFNVNSILMKQGGSPIITLNQPQEGGSKQVSDLFDNLVVPNWTLAFPFKHGGGYSSNKKMEEEEDDENADKNFVDDDIHDKLLNMITVHDDETKKSEKKQTRKYKIKKLFKNQTKRNLKNNKNKLK